VTLSSALKERARELGFLACGITDPSPTPHAAELDDWLAKGYAGTMRYLHRQAKRRKNPKINVPEALSIVVALDNYYSPDREADTHPPRIAKYARGHDYHRVTRRRLDRLGQFLLDHGAAVAHSYVDKGPIPERELAQRAGLGWIGKNTMLLRPGAGSFFFIGTIFTDLALPLDQPFDADHCGSCTRCLDACPTAAFVAPRVLDATRCISYLTIEQRGPIPDEIVPRLEGYAFGCDICNNVCPWNHRFAETTAIEELRPLQGLDGADPGYFDRMDEAEFAARFSDTPFSRPGLAGMRRNLHAAFASVEQHHER
jgi:epoxyqueuosine reductase